jgi:pimeloyl-ACP methyl ester carboxylesterase
MGHSEGSLIGILATNASEGNVNAFISLEGAGRPAEDVLKEQMKSQPEYLANGFQTILDSLRRGKLQKNVDPALYFIARPSIQMYLMSWCRFDPQKEIKQLKIPVLIVQGTSDLQVKMIDADKLKKGKSSATLTVIHGMNHVLKDAPDDKDKNLATYNQPNLPLKPELVTAVIDFIKGK